MSNDIMLSPSDFPISKFLTLTISILPKFSGEPVKTQQLPFKSILDLYVLDLFGTAIQISTPFFH